jgi:hypothetical protein
MQSNPLAFAANRQADIDNAGRRVEADAKMFAEVAAVLKKHGLEHKYGIALLHKHFDLGEDEMLVEFTDIENRTLTSKPVRIGSIPTENLVETNWCLDADTAVSICVTFCHFSQSAQQHRGVHESR